MAFLTRLRARLASPRLAAIAALTVAIASGCSPQTYLAVMPGVLNDPANRTLRRELLAFGTGNLCGEVMKRSVGLKLRDEDPTIGRFYPRQCNVQTLENGDLYIQFAGTGYAWSNVTKRLGFNASAALQYEQDFRLDGSTMYVYFRPAATTAKRFELTMTEQQQLPQGPLTTFMPGGSPQGFVNQIGEGLLTRELGKGFTVVRESDGTVRFAQGLLGVGQLPPEPFERKNDDRVVLTNERLELHQNQRDYVGPFDVPSSGMALYLTMLVEGAPAIDVSVYPRSVGDVWLQGYLTSPVAGPPPAAGLLDEAVSAPFSGMSAPPLVGAPPGGAAAGVYRRIVRLPKGSYYLVLDNTATAGRTAPTSVALDDRAALVSLGVELGDEP